VLAFASNVATVVLGAALWGLHMGLTQGILASLVADTAPADLRGTAFGLYSLVAGVATVAASVVAGALWDFVGPQVTFVAGAVFTALALAAVPVLRRSVAGST
jgi:MFS family permease